MQKLSQNIATSTKSFKEQCIQLRMQNFTLGEMVKVLHRPKTSVYAHIRNIPKTSALIRKLKLENLARLKRIRPTLKGISLRHRHCKPFKSWTPSLVNLVAHAFFDGEIVHEGVIYNNRSVTLIKNFESKMKIIYEHPAKTYTNPDGVMRLSYYSVELTNLFRQKKQELLEGIVGFDMENQRAFLRAFFDDEGCVTFRHGKRIVRGYQKQSEILFLIHRLLKNFGIESKVDARFHEIIISRRLNLEAFAREINFSPGLRVNGNRSNSIWKKSLEKRRILDMALGAYRN